MGVKYVMYDNFLTVFKITNIHIHTPIISKIILIMNTESKIKIRLQIVMNKKSDIMLLSSNYNIILTTN